MNELNVTQLASELGVPETRIEELLRDHGIQAEGGIPIWHGDLLDLLQANLARPQIRHTTSGRLIAAMADGGEVELCDLATLVDTYMVSEAEIEATLSGFSTVIPGHYGIDVLPILDAAFLPSFTASEEGTDHVD